MWNCTDLDLVAREVHQLTRADDIGVMLLVGGLFVIGGLLIVAGEQLARPLGGLVGGIGGTVATFAITAAFDMPCEARLIAAGVVGILAAGLALFVLKTGVFLLGAGSLAAVTHLVYESLPLDPPAEDDLVLLGRPAYYYAAMLAALVAGGLIAYVERKKVLQITSALLGGGAWGLAVFVVVDRNGTSLPQAALLGIVFVCTLSGVTIQRWRGSQRKRRWRRRDESPPMGIPVVNGSRT